MVYKTRFSDARISLKEFLQIYRSVFRCQEINSVTQSSEKLLRSKISNKQSYKRSDNIYEQNQNKNSLILPKGRIVFNDNKCSFGFPNNLDSSELFVRSVPKKTVKKKRSKVYETCKTNNMSSNLHLKLQQNKKRSINISEYENFNDSTLSSVPVNQSYEKSSIRMTESISNFVTHSVHTSEDKTTNLPLNNHSPLLSNFIEEENKTNANKRSYVPWEKQPSQQNLHMTGIVNGNSHLMQEPDIENDTGGNTEHTTETEHTEVVTEEHTITVAEHRDFESETITINEQQSSGTDHKNECEKLHGRKCICLFNAVMKDLESIVSKKPDVKVNLLEINNYVCTSYGPLPISFSLSPNVKPKILHKTEKILVADEEKGPKEVDEKSLDDLMQFNIDDEGKLNIVITLS